MEAPNATFDELCRCVIREIVRNAGKFVYPDRRVSDRKVPDEEAERLAQVFCASLDELWMAMAVRGRGAGTNASEFTRLVSAVTAWGAVPFVIKLILVWKRPGRLSSNVEVNDARGTLATLVKHLTGLKDLIDVVIEHAPSLNGRRSCISKLLTPHVTSTYYNSNAKRHPAILAGIVRRILKEKCSRDLLDVYREEVRAYEASERASNGARRAPGRPKTGSETPPPRSVSRVTEVEAAGFALDEQEDNKKPVPSARVPMLPVPIPVRTDEEPPSSSVVSLDGMSDDGCFAVSADELAALIDLLRV